MARLEGQGTGTIDLADVEYFNWSPDDSPVSVHMHLDAVDGIIRDVVEGFESLPRRGLEVGGLLLGRVEAGDRPSVWIERYQRISCEHQFGPQFLLDDNDKEELEKAAAEILAGGELAVVGLYRSHTREGFQLEPPDFDLIRSYFSDASDLVLLLKPQSITNISARFYVHDAEGGARSAGESFPFRGRVLSRQPAESDISPEPVATAPLEEKKEPPKPAAPEPAPREPISPEPISRERPRRLVPDFAPSPVAPSQGEPSHPAEPPAVHFPFAPREPFFEEEEQPSASKRLLKWFPIVAALLLAGGGLWWLLQPSNRPPQTTAAPVAPNEPSRPLGLAVAPMGKAMLVSWNPNATALHDARSVQLFVRVGDDQNRIDLSPRDLAAGTYTYQSPGNDVTFRLEVTDSAGRISAESFRFERSESAAAPPAAAPKASEPSRPTNIIHRTEPRAIHRAPPVIASGIRPRISGTIPIDVRVHVDEHGRVTSAAPVTKPHQGLDAYLADSAVKAARLWRFEPATENGKPVPGSQTIHFVFQR
jgi:TonB family protein